MFPFINRSVILENVKNGVDKGVSYIQCRCPACALDGEDANGKNHLRIYATGAFSCAKYPKEGKEASAHNKTIRKLIRAEGSTDVPTDVVFIDPDPKLETDKVYPESTLSGLLPDHSYWIGRGIKPEVLMKMEGGLASKDVKSKLSGRYVFPIRAPNGQIMGFTGRLVSDNSFAPKWKHLFRSSRSVYPINITEPYIKKNKRVVIVESLGDCASLFNVGIWEVLVCFGLNFNSRMVGTLVGLNPSKIVISTNNDAFDKGHEVGNRAAEKLQKRLRPLFGDKVIVRLPKEGNDWNSTTETDIAAFKAELES